MSETKEALVVERGVRGIPCQCGGYSDRVQITAEEAVKYGCGRDRVGFECCARAFVCRICGTRMGAYAEAPEMG